MSECVHMLLIAACRYCLITLTYVHVPVYGRAIDNAPQTRQEYDTELREKGMTTAM